MNKKGQPPIPAGDYLLYYRDGRYAAIVAVDNGGHIEPPAPGQAAQFWGVYVRNADDSVWRLYADVSTLANAREAAEAALMAVMQ